MRWLGPANYGILAAAITTLVVLLFAVTGIAPAASVKRDYFKELGVRPIINAAGTYTALTASLMLPEVMDAINYSSKTYVRLQELHDAVGERIAKMIGCEASGLISDEELVKAVRAESRSHDYDEIILATGRQSSSRLARLLRWTPIDQLRRRWKQRLIVFPSAPDTKPRP